MKIISRAEWGARPAHHGVLHCAWRDRTAVMMHHSGGPAGQSVRAIQDHCMDDRGFLDIDYNWLIDQDGQVYEGRGWSAVGSHAVGWNTKAIGICVIGREEFSGPARAAARELYAHAIAQAGKPLATMVHQDVAKTACPGASVLGWVKAGFLAPRLLCLATPYVEGHDVSVVQSIVGVARDGVYGPRTEGAVVLWQAAHHLVADGVVGPRTLAAMGL